MQASPQSILEHYYHPKKEHHTSFCSDDEKGPGMRWLIVAQHMSTSFLFTVE